jgi:heme/copper-type cytochrome/quinol oxidase subunit 3
LTLSISQNYLYFRSKSYSLFYLFITIILAFIFSAIQLFEYLHSSFSIYDSIYATNFYILTGFHGIHVIIGSSLLLMSFFKLFFNHFIMSPSNLVAFHSSAIY